MVNPNANLSFGYDDFYRLIDDKDKSLGSMGFDYDAVSNRRYRIIGGSAETYQYIGGTNSNRSITITTIIRACLNVCPMPLLSSSAWPITCLLVIKLSQTPELLQTLQHPLPGKADSQKSRLKSFNFNDDSGPIGDIPAITLFPRFNSTKALW
jgi:hypothetical protein